MMTRLVRTDLLCIHYDDQNVGDDAQQTDTEADDILHDDIRDSP